ncbi:hypothetical protein BJ912DRAFT_930539 [Pholiota molesta]|nr:hypothetical protein BJ912DRAFT_930539 [Pholiota molesta]
MTRPPAERDYQLGDALRSKRDVMYMAKGDRERSFKGAHSLHGGGHIWSCGYVGTWKKGRVEDKARSMDIGGTDHYTGLHTVANGTSLLSNELDLSLQAWYEGEPANRTARELREGSQFREVSRQALAGAVLGLHVSHRTTNSTTAATAPDDSDCHQRSPRVPPLQREMWTGANMMPGGLQRKEGLGESSTSAFQSVPFTTNEANASNSGPVVPLRRGYIIHHRRCHHLKTTISNRRVSLLSMKVISRRYQYDSTAADAREGPPLTHDAGATGSARWWDNTRSSGPGFFVRVLLGLDIQDPSKAPARARAEVELDSAWEIGQDVAEHVHSVGCGSESFVADLHDFDNYNLGAAPGA